MATSSASRGRKRGSISSESSFYGSDGERARLEDLCDDFDPVEYLRRPPTIVEQAQRAQSSATPRSRLRMTPRPRQLVTWPPREHSPKPEPSTKTRKSEPSSESHKPPTELHNPYAHLASAWQIGEDITTFLQRLPPSRTLEQDAGPWIWAANPHLKHRELDADYKGLREDGEETLDELSTQKREFGRKGVSKYKAVRLEAEKALLESAKKLHVTTGKWLLFRTAHEIDEAWSIVATGTTKGKLGCSAKVATRKSLSDGGLDQVICVYTEDFSDEDDVVRVLRELDGKGVVGKRGPLGSYRGIYYKPDVYTHLGIMSGNEWDIPPSLYASTTFINPPKRV